MSFLRVKMIDWSDTKTYLANANPASFLKFQYIPSEMIIVLNKALQRQITKNIHKKGNSAVQEKGKKYLASVLTEWDLSLELSPALPQKTW